jgi:hypothetical protein
LRGSGRKEVGESGTAIEFGKEKCGVSLCFRGMNPSEAWSDDTVVMACLPKYSTPVATHPHLGVYMARWLWRREQEYRRGALFQERERETVGREEGK